MYQSDLWLFFVLDCYIYMCNSSHNSIFKIQHYIFCSISLNVWHSRKTDTDWKFWHATTSQMRFPLINCESLICIGTFHIWNVRQWFRTKKNKSIFFVSDRWFTCTEFITIFYLKKILEKLTFQCSDIDLYKCINIPSLSYLFLQQIFQIQDTRDPF